MITQLANSTGVSCWEFPKLEVSPNAATQFDAIQPSGPSPRQTIVPYFSIIYLVTLRFSFAALCIHLKTQGKQVGLNRWQQCVLNFSNSMMFYIVHRFPKTSHRTLHSAWNLRPAFSFCTSQQATTIALKEGIKIDLTILRLRPTWLLQRAEPIFANVCVCVCVTCLHLNKVHDVRFTYKVPKNIWQHFAKSFQMRILNKIRYV